jgi:hypothetical protein
MKRSISVRVVTVLFAGSLFGAYVVYSQLARNPQAATHGNRNSEPLPVLPLAQIGPSSTQA